jgi:hypothetical protein
VSGPSNTATITAVNDPPVAHNDSYSVPSGGPLSIVARGVLANDTDVDSDVNTLTAVLATPPSHGVLALNTDGSFAYTPVAGFAGTDSFRYYAKDVTPISSANAAATVTLTVSAGVQYTAVISPLKTPAQQGSAVPVSWTLRDALGNSIVSLSTLSKMESVFNGAPPQGGCVASASGTKETLYNLPIGATGNSSFRLVSGGYQFNWDTTTTATPPVVTGKGCYTLLIYLADQSAPKLTTPVQLK